MGLLTTMKHRLQQAVTSVLYRMWQTLPTSNSDEHMEGFKRWGSYMEAKKSVEEEELRCEHYPYEALLSGYTSTASFIANKTSPFVLPDDNDIEATRLIDARPIKVLEDFSESLSVMALFVTNVKRFVLKHEGKASFTVFRSDVDWQGVLKEAFAEASCQGLAEACQYKIHDLWGTIRTITSDTISWAVVIRVIYE